MTEPCFGSSTEERNSGQVQVRPLRTSCCHSEGSTRAEVANGHDSVDLGVAEVVDSSRWIWRRFGDREQLLGEDGPVARSSPGSARETAFQAPETSRALRRPSGGARAGRRRPARPRPALAGDQAAGLREGASRPSHSAACRYVVPVLGSPMWT